MAVHDFPSSGADSAAITAKVTVANQTARYALTTAEVQNGDYVAQTDTGAFYVVVDDEALDGAGGYERLLVSDASGVPITGIPYATNVLQAVQAILGQAAGALSAAELTSGDYKVAAFHSGYYSAAVSLANLLTALGAAPLASPALTGNPTAPTQSAGNNSTRVATTAYADAAAAATAAGWTTVTKTADETITNDNTLSNDSALSFAVLANTKYRVRGVVHFLSGSTADFKWAFTGPASPTLVRGRYTRLDSSSTSGTMHLFTGTSYPSASHGADAGGVETFDFIFHNGANAGTLTFQWAQETSAGDSTTVYAGSYLEYKAV